MASVQERLQLKRVPLENWSLSEQLYLASAVACSGDQNWMSVSRQLKTICGSNRPHEWFSPKTCAAQYEVLLGNVEQTKRKKRNEKDTSQTTVETPIELIVRKLSQERVTELTKLIQEERDEYQKLKHEINGIQNNSYDENQLREMLLLIETEERQREREKNKFAQWGKERETDRNWRSNTPHQQSPTANIHSPALTQHLNQKIKVEEMEVDDPNAKQGTSPLLTSLLKSPSAAPNPSSSMLHNMTNQQSRVAAPTITNLLTGSVANLPSSMAAAQQTNTKTISAPATTIATAYPTPIHNQPLTGPAPNDHSIGNIAQSPSQAAPTLSMLLESKQKENMLKMPALDRMDSQNSICSIDQQSGNTSDNPTKSEPSDMDFNNAESPIKDDEQQLMDVFSELIPDDIDELADIILDDLINEDEQVAADSHATDNLVGQVNLDLKNFQNQPSHSTEATTVEIKDEPGNVSENTCDSTVASSKLDDAFDELKEQKDINPLKSLDNEEKMSTDLTKDDDSDLSNDTPLSELMKQEASAKQQRSQLLTPKEISSASDQSDEVQCQDQPQLDQPIQLEEGEQFTLTEEKVDDTVELLDSQHSEDQEDYLESIQSEAQSNFDVKSSDLEEKPAKIEIEMRIDSFESDSNEEKSMENIKRKIEALPELKDSNSSENSQDEKLEAEEVEVIEEKIEAESVDVVEEKNVEETFEKIESETDEKANELDEVKSTGDKDENDDSISIKDEITDLTTTKDEIIEHSENEETICDNEVEKSEPTDNENVESMDAEPCLIENVESPETVSKVEQETDSTAAETVVEILDDDILNAENMPDTETTPKEENEVETDLMETDALPNEPDDLIEIKSDDEKLDESLPEEKSEKTEEPVSSVKVEATDGTVDSKEKAEASAQPERKVSTDDELFEDAKETLEVEVKPPKPITPAIICDTDDDSPIEVIKEEKVGTKRDYSRRKKDQSHSDKRSEEAIPTEDTGGSISSRLRLKDRDRSESPYIDDDSGEPLAKNKRRYSTTPVIDSLPNSPASSDDRDHRSWKKSILLVYNSLVAHRCASTFAKPITEDQAPNYKTVILNPMDLQSLKRSIDSGQIRTTIEFQRYVMLMCYNAIFYNVRDDILCSRAKEMLSDALQLIAEFQVTWKKDIEKPATVSSSGVTKVVRGRKSNRLAN